MQVETTRTQVWKDAARESSGPLGGLLELSLEGMLGAMSGLGEIAVCAVLHRVRMAVTKLIFHGVVAALRALVWFFGSLAAVGIVSQMVADTLLHGRLSNRINRQKTIVEFRLRSSNDRRNGVGTDVRTTMSLGNRKLL